MYQVYIQATPEAIWEAITSPEWIEKYGYRGRAEYDLRPGGSYKALATEDMLAMGTPEVVVEGEVLEADPPRRLVQTYRFNWSPELLAEGFTRVTWETQDEGEGITRLTVTHELEGAPMHAEQVVGLVPLAPGRRRMELDPQRPQDAARDRERTRQLICARGDPGRRGPRACALLSRHERSTSRVARYVSTARPAGGGISRGPGHRDLDAR